MLDGTAELDPERWDSLARQAGFYVSRHWIRAWEEHAGARPLMVAVYDDDRLLGAVPCFETRAGTGNPRYDLGTLLDVDNARLDPQLFGGGNSGYRGDVLYERAAPSEARAAVLSLLMETLTNVAATRGARGWSLLYLDGRTAAEVAPYTDAHRLIIGASATMPLEYEDFDGYLGSLSTSNRSNARRDIRSFERSGATVEARRGLAGSVDLVAPLLGNVQGHHGADPSVAGAAGYLRLCAAGGLDDQAVVFLARLDGRPVAFSLAYEFGGRLWMRVVGLDYDRAPACGAYFTTYFYEPVRYALARGLREIDFGMESFEGKLRRGARLRPQWAVASVPGVDLGDWNARRRAHWLAEFGHHRGFHPDDWSVRPSSTAAPASRTPFGA
ncbi:hypothetical protein GCM10022243_15960 [Saccharothrix violaceirubra]